jgi:hypothetical protein
MYESDFSVTASGFDTYYVGAIRLSGFDTYYVAAIRLSGFDTYYAEETRWLQSLVCLGSLWF